MKIISKSIIPFVFIKLNQIIHINAQLFSPHIKAYQSSQNVITEEQLNSFSYGADSFKLAIIGDSGTEKEANEVMKLSSFDALLHLGDYDYECSPDKYFHSVLDKNRKYQFMGIIGNHDAKHQCSDSEAERFTKNVYNEMTSSKNNKVKCEFSPSKFMWACVYKNMRVIGLTPGINGADKRKEQLQFLKKHLNSSSSEDWKICSWHFYDKYYHTGKYPEDGNIISGSDSDSESFYDYCKDQGAIIFSAHDHVYARTHVMSQFKKPVIDKYDSYTDASVVQIRKGATLNILNGTGGWEIYVEQGEQKDYSHWQKKYAKGKNGENAKKYGGLFCDFNYGGNPRKAYCQFLRINSSDKVFDSFYIYRNDNPGSVKYSTIDSNFKNEKLIAYKTAHHITDNSSSNNTSNSNTNNSSSNSSSNNLSSSSSSSSNSNSSTNNSSNNNTNASINNKISNNVNSNTSTNTLKENNKTNNDNKTNNNNSDNKNASSINNATNANNTSNASTNSNSNTANNNIEAGNKATTTSTSTLENDANNVVTNYNMNESQSANNATNISNDVDNNNLDVNTVDNSMIVNNNNSTDNMEENSNLANHLSLNYTMLANGENKGKLEPSKTYINTTTLGIGGSVCVAIAAISGGVFIYKRNKKYSNIPEMMQSSFSSVSNNFYQGNKDYVYSPVKTDNHITNGFPSENQNQETAQDYHHKSYYSENDGDGDQGHNNFSNSSLEYNYYINQPETSNKFSPQITFENNFNNRNNYQFSTFH
jgi:hypothetical protein